MFSERKTKPRRRQIVALEWDGSSVRVGYALITKKGVRLEKVFSVRIDQDVDASDPVSLGRFIRGVLDEQGISARSVVMDVPRDQAILSTLVLPVGAPDELPNLVRFQIAKELPFPVEEAVVDFAVPPLGDEKTAPILVAAVRNEVIGHFKAVLQAAGLKLDRIGLRPFASKIAVSASLGGQMPDRVLFIDVGPTLTEIDVLSASSVPFSRAASVMVPSGLSESSGLRIGPGAPGSESGGPVGDRSEEGGGVGSPGMPLFTMQSVVRTLTLEVARSVEAYRARERDARITHALIAGDMGVEDALEAALSKRFDFEVSRFNPSGLFDGTPEEGEAASGFAAVFGLILGHDVDALEHFDFLHPKESVSQAQVQLRRAPRFLGWAAAILVTLGLVYWTSMREKLAERAELRAQVDDLAENKAEREKFIKFVESLKGYDDRQFLWVNDFYDLAMLLPDHKTFVLEEVRMNGSDREIRFRARFTGKPHQEWKTAYDLASKLIAYRREGASRPRYEVELGKRGRTLSNSKYPVRQDFTVRLLNDGYSPAAAKVASGDASGSGGASSAEAKTGGAPASGPGVGGKAVAGKPAGSAGVPKTSPPSGGAAVPGVSKPPVTAPGAPGASGSSGSAPSGGVGGSSPPGKSPPGVLPAGKLSPPSKSPPSVLPAGASSDKSPLDKSPADGASSGGSGGSSSGSNRVGDGARGS